MKNVKTVSFVLDGTKVTALEGESIWQVAKRLGTSIPHLCYSEQKGYRSDGNCRACMVEVEGERTLAASCVRAPNEGMVVNTATARAQKSRKLVFELLAADQPSREVHPDPESVFWKWTDAVGAEAGRMPKLKDVPRDISHSAIHVNLDACINCNLCVRACREVQSNDVIGMAYRGHGSQIVFDFDDPMGDSTCVACGECVQICPTGALIEKSLVNSDGVRTEYADTTVETLCPFCGVGCQTDVHVKDNLILHVDGRDGPANESRLCVKGRFGYDYIHHDGRLTQPLIRREDAPKHVDLQIAPDQIDAFFRPASWDEALEKAATGFRDILNRDGADATCGFGSAKGSNEEAYLVQKLVRTGFGTNNVDHCTRLCHASSVAALLEGVGSGAVSAPFNAANEADCIIIIGARPTVNHPVAATYFKAAAKRGAKLVIMDPRRNEMSRLAWKHLAFKPGRDVALLNAMLHVIIEEDLYDRQYVQSMTEGFDELRARISEYSPENMQEICGISAEDIRETARAYATSPRSIIFWGMGISQHVHGTDNARCLIALALLTGQIGRPGTGLHPLRGQNNVQGASDAGLIPMFYPDYISVENAETRARMQQFWGTELSAERGLTVVEIVNDIHADGIKGMYVMGENPAMSDPDQHHTRSALAMLEHMVVQDIFLTETAWFADVIFPASAHAEKEGTFTNTNRQVQIGRPAVTPPGEARQDWNIIVDLANALGLGWNYKSVSEVFAEMAQIMPSLNNITWDRLQTEGSVTYPCEAPDEAGQDIVFSDRFPTASGRARIVPADLVPPDELPDDTYPMVLTTGRLLEHWHTGSMTRRSKILDALEPEAVVSMNGSDIRRMALTPGNMVQVTTRRGSIRLKLREDWELPQGLVFIPFCYAEAPANALTNPQLDPIGKIPEFKFCAVRVEAVVQEAAE
uniref:formate dehydrogenase subunit alpha n=1 Tax=Pararhizobium sp. IMCC3301 TaxID=3067904 RepID=UPI002740A8BF|nr:formate dehydrogenase subunit alpha [Pararhizobium sp. IMCC3301]